MLALDQTNEKKMKKISSLKQECNVQNMAVIVCLACVLVYGHQRCKSKQIDQYNMDTRHTNSKRNRKQLCFKNISHICFLLLHIAHFRFLIAKIYVLNGG